MRQGRPDLSVVSKENGSRVSIGRWDERLGS